MDRWAIVQASAALVGARTVSRTAPSLEAIGLAFKEAHSVAGPSERE